MSTSETAFYNPPFSHIYLERSLIHNEDALRIIARFPKAHTIIIDHYKDVFCRSAQNYVLQHKSQALIIARDQDPVIYEGAPVCQSFDNKYFYYTSGVMNCVYDCDYCFLKGMYSSSNIVVFINIEDTFAKIEELLKLHPVYLCVSYDTDLIAIENLFGMVRKWSDFEKAVNAHFSNKLTIEVRTKCSRISAWDDLPVSENMIYAFTLSPDPVVEKYEHKTPCLDDRLKCINSLIQKGYRIRLCFDPMIYIKDWKKYYREMILKASVKVDLSKISDISIGSFRISKDYLKKMRKIMPDSLIAHFPYENDNGVYHYPDKIMNEMEGFLFDELAKIFPKEKIFLWRE